MSQASSRRLAGKTILLLILLASFFCLFYVLWNVDREGFPRDFSFTWTAAVALVMLFPILAAHIHVVWLSMRIGWVSWWACVTLATICLIWMLARFEIAMATQPFFGKDEVVSWFFSGWVGGTLGALAVLWLYRRFAPSWLGYQKPEAAAEKKKLNIRTMFLWVTAVGLICGAFVNRGHLGLVEKHELHPAFWVPLGALNVGLFCLFILPVVTNWLNRAKPFWLASICLIVFCTLVPLALAVWITIATGFYGKEGSTVSFTYVTFFSFVSLFTVLWVAACRMAGLTHDSVSNSKPIGFFGFVRRSFGGMGWGLKYLGFAVGVVCFLYIAGWLGLHLRGGPERDPRLIHDSIVTSLGGADKDEDWIDVINRQASIGLSREENATIKLLQIQNPFLVVLNPEEYEYRKANNLSVLESLDPTVVKYAKELGFSEQEFRELPADEREIWLSDRHAEYQEELVKIHPFLNEGFFEFGEWDFDEDQEDPSLEETSIGVDYPKDMNRAEVLADFIMMRHPSTNLDVAPWNESDYPVGAEFLEKNKSKILQYREISKGHFYFPMVRDSHGLPSPLEYKSIESAMYLLRASAYFNVGSNRIDEAMEDCRAISRFRLGQRSATNLAMAIAYSEHSTEAQIRTLLRLVQAQEVTTHRMEAEQRVFVAKIKDQVCMKFGIGKKGLGRDTPATAMEFNSYSAGPIYSLYQSCPWLVDWNALNTELDRNIEYSAETMRLAAAGEITPDEFQRRVQEVCCIVYPSGGITGKEVHYSIFGNQFLAFANSPKAKGMLLAQLEMPYLEPRSVFNYRAARSLNELGLALRLYQKSNGSYPESLDQLVPNYIPELHLDPWTGKQFIYKLRDKTFLLYSIGRNQLDDGGDENSDFLFVHPYSDLIDYIRRESVSIGGYSSLLVPGKEAVESD